MKAIGFYQNHPIGNPQALQNIEVSTPELRDHDLLVEVKAVSVNPVDTKIRLGGDIPASGARILGWDATGTRTRPKAAIDLASKQSLNRYARYERRSFFCIVALVARSAEGCLVICCCLIRK